MTLRTRTCHICNQEIGRVHDNQAPALFADHIKAWHNYAYDRLASIHEQINILQAEFKAISGRFARESVYYRKDKQHG